MAFLFRILIIVALVILIYSAFKYLFNPKRKLELAHEKKQFYLYDDKHNVKKNFLLTYKGVLFEGKKHLGTTEKEFEVVTIDITTKNPNKLKGVNREDFHSIEQEILIHYPHAKIAWKSPVKEFLEKSVE